MSRVLVIGAYGMIGRAIARALLETGHDVTGMGRDPRAARRAFPGLDWHFHDMGRMTIMADWLPFLQGIDFVVNAAGALQDGPRDDLTAVHATSVAALAEACAMHDTGLIQISAAGVSPEAGTHFFRSKAAGDAAVRAAGGDFWILRPGLVLAETAYGGTALLRMLAAVPLVQPMALGEAKVQCVGAEDLAGAVCDCVAGRVAPGLVADLVEPRAHRLAEIVSAMRDWLGFAPARARIDAPGWAVRLAARGADALGRLGWRAPLRSTALETLGEGVLGDPGPWAAAGGREMRGLHEMLAAMPARAEDRLAARMRLAMPFVLAVLTVFWVLSGVIGLARLGPAAAILEGAGWPGWAAALSVAGWAVVDIGLGLAIFVRDFAKRAALGMVAVSLAYLALGSAITPGLWADPLGPLLKILPGAMLALVAVPMLESR